jgi:hypothetical protein
LLTAEPAGPEVSPPHAVNVAAANMANAVACNAFLKIESKSFMASSKKKPNGELLSIHLDPPDKDELGSIVPTMVQTKRSKKKLATIQQERLRAHLAIRVARVRSAAQRSCEPGSPCRALGVLVLFIATR